MVDKEYLKELNKLGEIKSDVKFSLISENYFVWDLFCHKKREEFSNDTTNIVMKKLISEENYRTRKDFVHCGQFGLKINVGDVCYIDYGAEAYIQETGFQHFGIIIATSKSKALVIPMTSNSRTYEKAVEDYHDELFAIPFIEGLCKPSVLFLNDAKFINTSRIIDIKSHIDKNSELFQDIKSSYFTLIDKNS